MTPLRARRFALSGGGNLASEVRRLSDAGGLMRTQERLIPVLIIGMAFSFAGATAAADLCAGASCAGASRAQPDGSQTRRRGRASFSDSWCRTQPDGRHGIHDGGSCVLIEQHRGPTCDRSHGAARHLQLHAAVERRSESHSSRRSHRSITTEARRSAITDNRAQRATGTTAGIRSRAR